MEDNSLLSPIPEMSHCRLAACHCGLESTGLAANDTKIRSLGKKGITNPVGENSDHKWGLLRETSAVTSVVCHRAATNGNGETSAGTSMVRHRAAMNGDEWWKEFGTYDQLRSETG